MGKTRKILFNCTDIDFFNCIRTNTNKHIGCREQNSFIHYQTEPKLWWNRTRGLICQWSTTPLAGSFSCRDGNVHRPDQCLRRTDQSVSGYTLTACLPGRAAYKCLCSYLEQVSLHTTQHNSTRKKQFDQSAWNSVSWCILPRWTLLCRPTHYGYYVT